MKQDNFLKVFIGIAAIAIAGAAAYFSIFGISKLFAGYALAVIIMASALEFGKLAAVTYLQQRWKEINIFLKSYLLIGVFVLMIITSAGIYGFLSNAYQQTASQLSKTEQLVSVMEVKQKSFNLQITNLDDRKKSKTERVNMLSSLRESQERRLDSLYIHNTWNSRASAKAIELNITQANEEIKKLDVDVSELNQMVSSLQDSIVYYDNAKIDARNNKASNDLGPLQYLSRLTGKPMDSVINWFIMLLIFVFDPFAVSLVIALNHLSTKKKLLTSGIPKKPIEKEQLATKEIEYDEVLTNHDINIEEDNHEQYLGTDYIPHEEVEENIILKPIIEDNINKIKEYHDNKIEPSINDTIENEDKLIPSIDDTTHDEVDEPTVSDKLKMWAEAKPQINQLIEDELKVENKEIIIDTIQDINQPEKQLPRPPFTTISTHKGMRPDGGISS